MKSWKKKTTLTTTGGTENRLKLDVVEVRVTQTQKGRWPTKGTYASATGVKENEKVHSRLFRKIIIRRQAMGKGPAERPLRRDKNTNSASWGYKKAWRLLQRSKGKN